MKSPEEKFLFVIYLEPYWSVTLNDLASGLNQILSINLTPRSFSSGCTDAVDVAFFLEHRPQESGECRLHLELEEISERYVIYPAYEPYCLILNLLCYYAGVSADGERVSPETVALRAAKAIYDRLVLSRNYNLRMERVQVRSYEQYDIGDEKYDPEARPEYDTQRPEAQEYIERVFGLESDPGYQDYPLEISDPDRFLDFLSHYERHYAELSDDVKFTLMSLILYSYDIYFGMDGEEEWASSPDELQDRIRNALLREGKLFYNLVHYWSYLSSNVEEDPDCGFAITLQMRSIFEEMEKPL